MARFSLNCMERAPKGCFLMNQGGRIDHACHANDEDRLGPEMAEFDRGVEMVRAWCKSHPATLEPPSRAIAPTVRN